MQILQSGGPRTTPSGYPGGPVVPSGQLSPQHTTVQASQVPQQSHNRTVSQHPSSQSVGYSTTGRMSVHQQHSAATSHQAQNQGPVSFTRALEMTENFAKEGNLVQSGVGSHSQNTGKNNSSGATGESGSQDNQKRDSVYDVNNYEISV